MLYMPYPIASPPHIWEGGTTVTISWTRKPRLRAPKQPAQGTQLRREAGLQSRSADSTARLLAAGPPRPLHTCSQWGTCRSQRETAESRAAKR